MFFVPVAVYAAPPLLNMPPPHGAFFCKFPKECRYKTENIGVYRKRGVNNRKDREVTVGPHGPSPQKSFTDWLNGNCPKPSCPLTDKKACELFSCELRKLVAAVTLSFREASHFKYSGNLKKPHILT